MEAFSISFPATAPLGSHVTFKQASIALRRGPAGKGLPLPVPRPKPGGQGATDLRSSRRAMSPVYRPAVIFSNCASRGQR